jgi:hypothetical protein
MKASAKIVLFLEWIIDSAIDLDDAVRATAKEDRRSGRMDSSHMTRELVVGAGATRTLSAFYGLMTEMALCRAVDNYIIYLTELLSLVFRAHPESLRSGEEVRLDLVLRHATRASLIKSLIERKVNQLSYQGMRDLAQYLSKRLNFELFQEQDALERAILLVEMRNAIVHNRGIVNETFVRRVAPSLVPHGKQLRFSVNDLRNHVEFLAQSVADIEHRARDKFGISLPHKVPQQSDATVKSD